jgi:intein-encoded DNA endonuclease-like protein
MNIDKIIADYKTGKPVKHIASEHGCHPQTINRLLLKEGVRVKTDRATHIGKLEQHCDQIIHAYEGGMEMRELANQYVCDVRSMRRFLERHGVQIRHAYNNRPGHLDGKVSEIVDAYVNGMDCTQLGEKYGCSNSSIRALLERNGISRRDLSFVRRKYAIDDHYFDIIDTEEKAYILGWLYTDGYNHRQTNTVSLEIQESDVEILEKIKNAMGYNDRPLKYRTKPIPNGTYIHMVSLLVCNREISKKLEEHGVRQAKSHTITFPSDEIVPPHLKRHFIRGCFDGDGSFGLYKESNRSRKWACSLSGQKQFFDGFANYLTELGITNGIWVSEYAANLQISRKSSFQALYNLLYADATIYLERKYQKATDILQFIGQDRPSVSG